MGDRFRRLLPRGEFGRGITALVLGTGGAQLIVIATSPILTRLYSPSDYGAFAVATSILSVLITVTCLRYDYAIPLPESDVVAANVLGLALMSALCTSLLAALVLILFGGQLLALFGAGALAPYVGLLALGQLGGGVVSAFTNWAVRTKAFPEIARMRLTQGVALVTVQIGAGLLRAGAPGLLVGDVTGRVMGSTRLARGAWREHAAAFRSITRPGIAAAASRYRRFPIYSSGSALLATLGLQAPVLLLAAYYGTEVSGQYALAARICAVPLTLVAVAVGQVFVAEAARLARGDPALLRSLFVRTTRTLAIVAIGPAILAMVLAPLVFRLIFGEGWPAAGLYVAILVPTYTIEFVTASTGDILYVLERQGLHLRREVLRFFLIGGAVPLAAALGLDAPGAVVISSVAGALAYTLYGVISWRAVRAHRPSPSRMPEQDGVPLIPEAEFGP